MPNTALQEERPQRNRKTPSRNRTGKRRYSAKASVAQPKPVSAEVEAEAKANLTDPESRIMKTRKGGRHAAASVSKPTGRQFSAVSGQ